MEKFAGLLALLVCAGCSSNTVVHKGPCQLWNGTYALDVVKRTGDCKVPAEVLVNADGTAPTVTAPCKGKITMSADNCEEDFDYACPSTDGNGQGVFRGTYHLAEDGSGGNGELDFTDESSSGDILCQGTYDATIKKL